MHRTIAEDREPVSRLAIGLAGAMLIHAAILYGLYATQTQNIVAAELFSPPLAVAVRITQPALQPPVEPPEIVMVDPPPPPPPKAASEKAEILNRIEPAAAPPPPVAIEKEPEPVEVTEQAPEAIPVVREVNLQGSRIPPEYPRRALRLRQEGVVLLHVLVSETGLQEDIRVAMSSAYELLDAAALRAVRQWRFEPTVINGRAVKSWVEIPVEFKIQ